MIVGGLGSATTEGEHGHQGSGQAQRARQAGHSLMVVNVQAPFMAVGG
jgi:hypothetical protein